MAEENNRKIIQKIAIVAALVCRIAAFSYFDLGHYLTLEYLKSSQQRFLSLYQANRLPVIAAYMGIYIAVTALSLPGAAPHHKG